MSNCLLDVVVAVDLSVSTGLPGPNSIQGGAIYEGERRLLESIVQSLNSKMQAGEAQVGLVFFEGDPDHILAWTDGYTMTSNVAGSLNTIPSSSNPGGLSNLSANMYDYAYFSRPNHWSTVDDYTHIPNAITCAGSNIAGGGCYQFGVINAHSSPSPGSSLGDRTGQPDFKKVIIVISGAHVPVDPNDLTAEFGFKNQNAWPGLTGSAAGGTIGCQSQSISLSGHFSTSGPTNQLVIGVVVGDKDINNLGDPAPTGGMTQINKNQILSTLDAITCVQNGLGFYVNANSSDIPAVVNAINSEICSSVVRTYNCSGQHGVSLLGGGTTISPWTCYDPGTGSGVYQGPTAFNDCTALCKDPGEIGIIQDLGLTGATDPLCKLCCCEEQFSTSTGVPLSTGYCVPGSQIQTSNIWPCDCSTLSSPGVNMIDCVDEDTYKSPIDYGLDPGLTGGLYKPPDYGLDPGLTSGPLVMGWNCEYNNLKDIWECVEVLGGLYLDEPSCEAVCGVVVVGSLCTRIRSCPCGWNYDSLANTCDFADFTGSTMTIPSIENCMSFQTPPSQPVVGDVWVHSSQQNYPLNLQAFTWSAAKVVQVGGSANYPPSVEVRDPNDPCITL